MSANVIVVGGGISAASCASAVLAANPRASVKVVDKATRPGGRLGARTIMLPGGPHEVDIGAAYLTATSPEFGLQVNDWCERELLRPWTNSLDVYRGDEIQEPSVGPMRYAAASGLRSLVADAFETMQHKVDYQPNFDVVEVDQLLEASVQAIVFACPVPQAMRVLSPWLSDEQRLDLARFSSSPVISAWAWFAEKAWVDFNAAFINEHPLLSLMADDGARRGDGAPVLVAHSTEAFARSNESAEGKAEELIAAASQLLNFDEAAVGFGVHRWGLAQPRLTDQNPFWHAPNLLPRRKGGTRDDLDVMVGICGDEWGGRPKIETAWLSGQRLGRFIAEALAA